MKYQAAALALLLNTSTVLAGVQRRDGSDRRWGQCAGQNYNGPTDCPSGWTCQLQNSYYSQCLQGGGSGGNASGSGSSSGSVSIGYSNGTGSVSSGSTGSGTGLSGSGSKVGESSPASSSSSSLPGGVASSGTTATGTDTGADTEANGDDDDSEGTCDAEDEDDSTSSTTPAVAPAGKLAAQVTTGGGAAGQLAGSTTGGESSDGVASGGSGTSSASGSGASGDPTTEVKAVKQSDTEDSDTTGSDTTESGSGNTTGSGSSSPSSSNPNAGTTNSGISPGSALATTTQYGPITGTSPGSCGCAGSWQNGADNITTAAGGPSINDGYCGSGCGACYLLTSTGQAPCAGDACKVSAASTGATLTVMVTNSCPTQGNDVWCSVPNQYGYGAHFDLARQPEGWGNVVVSYAPTPCPGSMTSNWNTCKCAGKSTPHEGLVASGGKTSVA